MNARTSRRRQNRDRKEASQPPLWANKKKRSKQPMNRTPNLSNSSSHSARSQNPGAKRMLSRMESRLERTSSRALNTLLRFQHLRESNLDVLKKKGAKRTESQERTPSANLSLPAQHECVPPKPPQRWVILSDPSFQRNRGERLALAGELGPAQPPRPHSANIIHALQRRNCDE